MLVAAQKIKRKKRHRETEKGNRGFLVQAKASCLWPQIVKYNLHQFTSFAYGVVFFETAFKKASTL